MTPEQAIQLLSNLSPDDLALLTDEERALLDDVIGSPPPLHIIDRTHVPQTALVEDDARFLAVLSTRRGGKTYGAGIKQIIDAYVHPGSLHMFLGLTLASALRNAWGPVFKDLDSRFDLGLKFNESKSIITFPNGSMLYVLGMDANEEQKKKMRGGKYRSVVVDEAQDFSSDLDDLVKSILKPAIIDMQGWLMLQGTPGQMPIGLFYRITKDACAEVPQTWKTIDMDTATEWRGHTWSALQNPRVAELVRQEIADMLAINPAIADTPAFQREWRGKWVTDDDRRVYRYAPVRNDYKELPKYAYGEWHYVLGVDLGFNDDTALSIIAWHDHDRCAYIVEVEKQPGLDITDTANWIRETTTRYPIDHIVVDGANKQAVEEMRRRHGLPLIAADKREKAEFIDIINAEFIKGNIKLSPNCDALREEYAHLAWDERAWKRDRRVEDPRASNHACFVAGTIIATEHGERPIETIRAGDLVWTRDGLRRVTDCGMTGIRPVVARRIGGTTLTGTPDHPVWTENRGWVPLESVMPRDMLCGWADTKANLSRRSSGADASGGGIRSPSGPQTETTSATSRQSMRSPEAVGDCTEQSGSLITARSPMGATSTTSTRTRETTGSKTSPASTGKSTFRLTWTKRAARLLASVFSKPSRLLLRGIQVPRVAHGTPSTREPSRSAPPQTNACAGRAESSFCPRLGLQDCAATPAVLPTDGRVDLMTCSGTVPCATRHLASVDSPKQSAVDDLAPLDTAPVPVFNLTVEGTPEYFANGILVHNCDSANYGLRLVYAYLAEEMPREAKRGSDEWWRQEEQRMIARAVEPSEEEEELKWLV